MKVPVNPSKSNYAFCNVIVIFALNASGILGINNLYFNQLN